MEESRLGACKSRERPFGPLGSCRARRHWSPLCGCARAAARQPRLRHSMQLRNSAAANDWAQKRRAQMDKAKELRNMRWELIEKQQQQQNAAPTTTTLAQPHTYNQLTAAANKTSQVNQAHNQTMQTFQHKLNKPTSSLHTNTLQQHTSAFAGEQAFSARQPFHKCASSSWDWYRQTDTDSQVKSQPIASLNSLDEMKHDHMSASHKTQMRTTQEALNGLSDPFPLSSHRLRNAKHNIYEPNAKVDFSRFDALDQHQTESFYRDHTLPTESMPGGGTTAAAQIKSSASRTDTFDSVSDAAAAFFGYGEATPVAVAAAAPVTRRLGRRSGNSESSSHSMDASMPSAAG